MLKKNLLLLLLIGIITLIPWVFFGDAEFGGADGEAQEMINEINQSYEPWFSSLWEPPSGEIESLLFVLQGVIGAGFIGYFIGYMRGKNKRENVKHG